jgi:hypothetical protein
MFVLISQLTSTGKNKNQKQTTKLAFHQSGKNQNQKQTTNFLTGF